MDLVPSPVPAVVVLAVVLLVGVLAGRAKQRWTLLVAGVVVVLVLGGAVTLMAGAPEADPGARVTALYRLVVPLAVAFVAGWLCGRASWLWRFIVLAVAVLLLAAFPYEAAGRATADTVFPAAVPAAGLRATAVPGH